MEKHKWLKHLLHTELSFPFSVPFSFLQLHGYRGKEPLGLQIFIGTADERILKPHAFYQVHRITGKTVTTTSYEKIINGTKVLEMPLEPKNNMKAMWEHHNIYYKPMNKVSSQLSALLMCLFLPTESTALGSWSWETLTSSWGRARRTSGEKTLGFASCSACTYLSPEDSMSLSKWPLIPLSAVSGYTYNLLFTSSLCIFFFKVVPSTIVLLYAEVFIC